MMGMLGNEPKYEGLIEILKNLKQYGQVLPIVVPLWFSPFSLYITVAKKQTNFETNF